MSFLLDTHVFLWFERVDERLSKHVRNLLATTEETVFLSAASLWEIAIKRQLGKLDLDGSPREAARAAGFVELAIYGADAEAAGALDWNHRDPFDRMLAAQCVARGLTLITADAAFRDVRDLARLEA